MPRPSRNLDRLLLAAGRALLPQRGCAGLSVREVAEAAGVNLGMFHYHFKTREAFLRTLLQQMYEDMFVQLVVEGRRDWTPLEHLRAAMRFLGRFVRDNRPVLARVLADALSGEPIALDFVRRNMPRHLTVIHGLIVESQRAKLLAPVDSWQALAICAGSIGAPILFGGAVIESGALPRGRARVLQASLLSDAAIDERIELVLAALREGAGASRKAA